jgi:hypothetical protein
LSISVPRLKGARPTGPLKTRVTRVFVNSIPLRSRLRARHAARGINVRRLLKAVFSAVFSKKSCLCRAFNPRGTSVELHKLRRRAARTQFMLGPELPHAYVKRATRGRLEAPCDPRARTNIAESKLRQNVRIHDLGAALVESGFITLGEQSTALGLPRSTTWTIVSGNHKASGLSVAIIIRLLSASHLPALVRIKLMSMKSSPASMAITECNSSDLRPASQHHKPTECRLCASPWLGHGAK